MDRVACWTINASCISHHCCLYWLCTVILGYVKITFLLPLFFLNDFLSLSFTGETLKEQQFPRSLPKPSSSRLRDFKETMSNIIHNRPLSASSSGSVGPPDSTAKARDWEADSTSSESKSSSSGGRYRPPWKPRREALNIDSIFSRDRRKQAGYSPLRALLSEDTGPQGDLAASSEQTTFQDLPGPLRRGSEQPPRLIQRMESGYESSERNSNSPVSLDMPVSEGTSNGTHRYNG